MDRKLGIRILEKMEQMPLRESVPPSTISMELGLVPGEYNKFNTTLEYLLDRKLIEKLKVKLEPARRHCFLKITSEGREFLMKEKTLNSRLRMELVMAIATVVIALTTVITFVLYIISP